MGMSDLMVLGFWIVFWAGSAYVGLLLLALISGVGNPPSDPRDHRDYTGD